MIDWEKVPKEKVEELRTLDERLKAIEACYVPDYGNLISDVAMAADFRINSPAPQDNKTQIYKNILNSLQQIYASLDFSTLPRNEDTEPFFTCKREYDTHFLPLAQTWIKELEAEDPNPETARELFQYAQAICTEGRKTLGILNTLLRTIKTIPGGEDREFHPRWVSHKSHNNLDYR